MRNVAMTISKDFYDSRSMAIPQIKKLTGSRFLRSDINPFSLVGKSSTNSEGSNAMNI